MEAMSDKELIQLFIEQMEEELARDELMIEHLKNVSGQIEILHARLELALSFSRLPLGVERDAEGERIAAAFAQLPLRNESRRLIALHESQHERRGGFLARMREMLERL
jgi:hypothetical protein